MFLEIGDSLYGASSVKKVYKGTSRDELKFLVCFKVDDREFPFREVFDTAEARDVRFEQVASVLSAARKVADED